MKENRKIRNPNGNAIVFAKNFHIPALCTAVAINAAIVIRTLEARPFIPRRAAPAARHSTKPTTKAATTPTPTASHGCRSAWLRN
ncbi:hypothetical protein GCM10009839_23730 [Catenulispora yoronensis]|uniref:Uncharacterized protein n=1 Tax=Catenulispora yoronensis TaxID=450799 RepID=A0ABP5FHV1_9ACTN